MSSYESFRAWTSTAPVLERLSAATSHCKLLYKLAHLADQRPGSWMCTAPCPTSTCMQAIQLPSGHL